MKPKRHKSRQGTGKASKRPTPQGGKSRKRLITPAQARRLAAAHVAKQMFQNAVVRDWRKVRLCIYDLGGKLAGREFWVVYKNTDNNSGLIALKASTVVLVCKRTGEVLYEGSAGDEG